MSWQDRDYGNTTDGGRGRFRSALLRVFGDGENPFSWAVTLYRAWGIRVRLHIFFIIYVVVKLIASFSPATIGWPYMLAMLASLWVLVLLHEYGHCLAARRVGGEADEIILWPLGGLAMVRPPHDWRSHLITVLAGPGVNLALWPLLGLAVLAATAEPGFVVFSPFALGTTFSQVAVGHGWWVLALWWLYTVNAVLFLFNMLVPMYPMDAGRVVHSLIWRRSGEEQATRIATTVGLVAAGVLAVIGIVGNETLFLALAVFGGLTCYFEKRQSLFRQTAGDGIPGYDFSRGYAGMPGDESPPGPSKRDLKRLERERAEQEELDRLLAKIAEEGMQSLTRKERKWLDRTSAKRRAEGGGVSGPRP